jgi:hypothetical protein
VSLGCWKRRFQGYEYNKLILKAKLHVTQKKHRRRISEEEDGSDYGFSFWNTAVVQIRNGITLKVQVQQCHLLFENKM